MCGGENKKDNKLEHISGHRSIAFISRINQSRNLNRLSHLKLPAQGSISDYSLSGTAFLVGLNN